VTTTAETELTCRISDALEGLFIRLHVVMEEAAARGRSAQAQACKVRFTGKSICTDQKENAAGCAGHRTFQVN
jgi:hypothetical protein